MRIRHEPFAEHFYNSQAWKKCRAAYRKSVRGLCEECLSNGLYVPGDHVHHIVPLTPQNITDPSITLNPDNLMLLCEDCHKKTYNSTRRVAHRWSVDQDGRVLIQPPCQSEN